MPDQVRHDGTGRIGPLADPADRSFHSSLSLYFRVSDGNMVKVSNHIGVAVSVPLRRNSRDRMIPIAGSRAGNGYFCASQLALMMMATEPGTALFGRRRTFWSFKRLLTPADQDGTHTIQHQNLIRAWHPDAPASPVHRYRTTRPWSVSALAVAAAACAVVASNGFSAAFDAAEAIGPRLARKLESAPFVVKAHAAPAPAPDRTVRRAAPAAQATGWQIQVGALRSPGAAEQLLRSVASEVSDLANLPREAQAGGAVTRARFAGIADESAALDLCAKLSRRGRECLVVRPRG